MSKIILFTLGLFLIVSSVAFADEGMWTLDNMPIHKLKTQFGFEPSQEWLDHVRLSSVRLNDGGSGSFVSPNGLVMTNHHVAVFQLQKLSSKDNNIVKNGFYASSPGEEIKCADLEINVLISMENVTDIVKSASEEGMSEEAALKAMKKVKAKLEKESLEKTGLRSNIVDLYHGGEYWIYRYKKYTDIRLVCAPEQQAAYFGGENDNFTYPRYNLDFTFLRVYEDGKPLKTDHYFKWNKKGASEGELVFVSGNPGSTDRLYTHSQLIDQRDRVYPLILKMINRQIKLLQKYSERGQEEARRAKIRLFGLGNSIKAISGTLEGLLNEELIMKHKKNEDDLRDQIGRNMDWAKKYMTAWDDMEKIINKKKSVWKQRTFRKLSSGLASKALRIVRYVAEIQKDDMERLNGYHDSQLESFRYRLLSPAPVYKDMEIVTMTDALEVALDELGPGDEYLKIVLDGKSPKQAATQLINNTKLDEIAFRKELIEGGEEAIMSSDDPMIKLALKLDPLLRESDEWYRTNIESAIVPVSQKIAEARFEVFGKGTYPDATFSLRLSYGSVKGYQMNGTVAPYKTTLYGLYDRAMSFDSKGDYYLPERFWKNKDKLDLSTPVNFVCNCDIIGGNSGSPVINKDAEIVGLVFDGNIESLPGRFIFDESKNRTVSVHSAYIIESLRKLYDAGKLADEIEGK